MTDRRRDDGPEIASVRTAIEFVVKSVDRLEDSVVRLQQTVREDFASIDELDVVKHSLAQLREDVSSRLARLEEAAKATAASSTAEVKVSRWLVRVAIPAGALALLKLAWDLYGAALRRGLGGP